jgi:hypothetical protein
MRAVINNENVKIKRELHAFVDDLVNARERLCDPDFQDAKYNILDRIAALETCLFY